MRRGLKDRRYFTGLGERFGRLPASFDQTAPGAIWLHAVSVGEILTAVELVKRLREALPGVDVFVSTSTLAGRETAERKFPGRVFYAPLDYRFAVKRALRRLKPAVVVVMETEIWPNLYREAKRFGCGLVVVNGRISDKAIGKYERYRWFFRNALQRPDALLAQDEIAAGRYRSLGAANVTAGGNLKYDFDPQAAHIAEDLRQWLERVNAGEVWIAASTMPPARPGDVDEDDVVIDTFRALAPRHPGLLLVQVPRKPERFDEVAGKLSAAGVACVRRTQLPAPLALPGALLLDTIGELSGLFRRADVVFMGGTLAERGGHNPLEPAAFGKAVIAGPHMENFARIAADFEAAGALFHIGTPSELADAVSALLSDPSKRQAAGDAAAEQAAQRRGATGRAVDCITGLHARSLFAEPPGTLLRALAACWTAGARVSPSPRALDTPVVSIGNLSMGGTGKTPFVLWLARRLRESGQRPAILTRGYRRRSPPALTVVAPGDTAPVAETGDEAQILVRAAVGPVGIAADRYAAGRELERRFQPGVFLLDDGFQHRRLRRECDIVLIDALDPFGRGVFPAGRLREPESALARANILVLTRTEPGRGYDGVLARLRRASPSAPVFLSRVVPGEWRTLDGQPASLPDLPIGAFCGLANPASFWRTLAAGGVIPAWRESFPDHHRYTAVEVARLASHADVLVTTQKDIMNLPAGISAPVYWLDMRLEFDREEELLEAIRARLQWK